MFRAPLLFCYLLAGVAGGCESAANRKASLLDAVLEYSDGVRWGRPELVVRYLSRSHGQRILARRAGHPDLQVTDAEVDAVQVLSVDRALSTVRFDWYELREARLRRSVIQQTWTLEKGEWRLADQRWLRGAPFPLL
ncbi:MAG: hypothetical protein IT371_22045 [Deltaproteobacteria bacterium]|nr:hypothetical protein [Deltaproteobacteria bacterium]